MLSQKILDIKGLYIEMRDLTLLAKVSADMYEEVVKADELLTSEQLDERLDFLKEVRNGPYAEVKRVYDLLPPSAWDMYRMLGQKRLPEQVLLRKSLQVLRKAWTDHYGRSKKSEDQGD